MNTAKQHFEKLPEPHQTNCLNAMDKTRSDLMFDSTQDAIFWLIDWSTIPDKLPTGLDAMDYWEDLHDSCEEGGVG